MEYIVTARKFRPKRFDEIVGQEHITQTLKNAVRLNRIHHAYLFSGPRGVGKTTTARILSRVVNCENPVDAEPCNQCENCLSILEGRSLDVIEIDGASNNSVDDVRTIRENAKYPPINGKYKIYIIDEVHMLSTSAFNALLKILEEPPKHLIFIFATTEPHKVLPTIVSRCLRFDFHRLEIPIIVEQISKIANTEGIDIDEMSLYTIAKKADGSMRDAQSIFDQFVASAGKIIRFEKVKELLHIIDSDYFFKVSNAFVEKEPSLPFQISEELTKNGYDYAEFLSGLLEHFRNIFFVKVAGNPEKLNLPKSMQEKYIAEAQKFNEKDLIRILNLISNVEQQIKYATMPRIRLELLLSQIIEMPSVVEITELIEEIRQFRNQQARNTSHQSSPEKKTYTTASKPNSSNSNSDSTAWEQFLEKYNSKLNGLKGFCTSNLVEVEIKPNEVILIAKNDFVYENLLSKKNAIRQAVKEFFGRNYEFVLIQSEVESRTEPEPIKKDNSKIEAVKQTTNNQYSEVEKALKDLFGAREIAQP